MNAPLQTENTTPSLNKEDRIMGRSASGPVSGPVSDLALASATEPLASHLLGPNSGERLGAVPNSLPYSGPVGKKHGLWWYMLLVILGGVCISFSAIFVKASGVSPSMAVFYRCLFGGVTLAAISLGRGESLRPSKGAFGILFLVGATFAGDLIFWHSSIMHVGPGMSTILANFHVFFLAIIAFFIFKEKLSRRLVAGLPFALLGLWILFGVTPEAVDRNMIVGSLQGFAAAFWYAMYVIVLRHSQKMQGRVSAIASITIISLASTFFALFIVLFQEGPSAFKFAGSFSLIMMLCYGVLCQALGGLLFTYGLPRLPTTLGGPLMLVQPTLAFTWDVLFFNRPFNNIMLLGGLLTLGSIYMAVRGQMNLEGKRKSTQHEQSRAK